MKVFATGLNKTGTTSLGTAFRMLGLHTMGLDRTTFVDVVQGRWARAFAIADVHAAFHDWPWGIVYQAMSLAYPDAKFILTVRDSDEWFDSMVRYGSRYKLDTIYRKVFFRTAEPKEADREQCIKLYEQHIDDVRKWFANTPERLLILPTNKLAWAPVCKFLGLPEPNMDFPHVNQTTRINTGSDE